MLGFFVFCVLGFRGLGFLVTGKGTEVDLGFGILGDFSDEFVAAFRVRALGLGIY